jgi:hypothetical protein
MELKTCEMIMTSVVLAGLFYLHGTLDTNNTH